MGAIFPDEFKNKVFFASLGESVEHCAETSSRTYMTRSKLKERSGQEIHNTSSSLDGKKNDIGQELKHTITSPDCKMDDPEKDFHNRDVVTVSKKKTYYSAALKKEVLEFYSEHGPAAVRRKYGIQKQLLLLWRRKLGVRYYRDVQNEKAGEQVKKSEDCKVYECKANSKEDRVNVTRSRPRVEDPTANELKSYEEGGRNERIRSKRKVYDEHFKTEVIKYNKIHGPFKTARDFNINNSLIYQWIKNGVKSKQSCCSKEFKDQAIDSCTIHGVHATSMFLKVKKGVLYRWLRQEDVDLREIPKFNKGSITSKLKKQHIPKSIKQEILEYSKVKGTKAASQKYNVLISTVNRWKLKERAELPGKRHPCRTYDKDLQKKVVAYAVDHSYIIAGRKFSVPRQTVRTWVCSFAEGEIMKYRLSQQRIEEILVKTRKQGVKSVMAEERVKRSTLYYWSNKAGPELAQLRPSFGQPKKVFSSVKKPSVKLVKTTRKAASAKKEEKKCSKDKLDFYDAKLPLWAADFLNGLKKFKNNPSIENPVVLSSIGSPLVSDSETTCPCDKSESEPIFTHTLSEAESAAVNVTNVISLTLPVICDTTAEEPSSDADEEVSLIPMPMFTPNCNRTYGATRVTIDPPSLLSDGRPNIPADFISVEINFDTSLE